MVRVEKVQQYIEKYYALYRLSFKKVHFTAVSKKIVQDQYLYKCLSVNDSLVTGIPFVKNDF